MKKIILCIAILLLVCNAFSQTIAPSLTVAELIKLTKYSFDYFDTYLTKRGFQYDRTYHSYYSYIGKYYRYKPKPMKDDEFSCNLDIYSDGKSSLNYWVKKPAYFRKLEDEIRVLGFKYEGSYSRDGTTTLLYKRGRTVLKTHSISKTPSGVIWKIYYVQIESPAQLRVVSLETAKPKQCNEERSFDKGYSLALNQRGLVADCDYLFDMAETSDGPLSHYCFCRGVQAYQISSDFQQNKEANNKIIDQLNNRKNEAPPPPTQPGIITKEQTFPKMIPVAGGSFTMGDVEGEGEANEKPTHTVTLKAFSIAETETTVAQYRSYCNATGTAMPQADSWVWIDDHPIEGVNYYDAVGYTDWLSEKTGQNYRLPTEAEWECAARGGGKSGKYKYSGGRSLDEVGWYTGNNDRKSYAVAQKLPNELGLYDMSGNVWEWCKDWYGAYAAEAQTNPHGATRGANRVLRGGSWRSAAADCRVAFRKTSNSNPEIHLRSYGFRVVLLQ